MTQVSPSPAQEQPEPPRLKFLRWLVIILTATMIVGLITIVALIVMTFMRTGERTSGTVIEGNIALPEGQSAQAFTRGTGWNAIVTRDEEGVERILITDPETGDLRQSFEIK